MLEEWFDGSVECSVRAVIKEDVLMALAFSVGDEKLREEYQKSSPAEKNELGSSLCLKISWRIFNFVF